MKRLLLKSLRDAAIFFVGMTLLDYLILDRFEIYWGRIVLTAGIFVFFFTQRMIRQKNIEKAGRYNLVVAADCTDKASAEAICNMLETNGIKAMVVEKNSPIYIENASLIAPVQVQVCKNDLEIAVKLINE